MSYVPPLRTSSPFALLLALALAACGDSPTDLDSPAVVEIEAPELMDAGAVVQASASVFDEDGVLLPDHPVTWESTDETVAVVDVVGLITALEPGTTELIARANGVSDSITLEVRPDPCLASVGSVGIGDTVEGVLTEESCFLESWFHDAWDFEVEEETRVQIDLTSPDFNPFLILTDSVGSPLAEDDDSGEGFASRVQVTLPAGPYLLWASTSPEEETGSYALTVRELEELP